jgi:hypothetical protein
MLDGVPFADARANAAKQRRRSAETDGIRQALGRAPPDSADYARKAAATGV